MTQVIVPFALGDKEIEAITDHYDKYFHPKEPCTILHEIASSGIHLDIAHYAPSEKHPYHIFATIGMSGYKMKHKKVKRMELIMLLPPDWKTKQEDFNDANWYWPIKMLKTAARIPLESDSYLDFGHTFSMDENYSPFAEVTDMCCGLIGLPLYFDYEIRELKIGSLFNRKKINFFSLTAINRMEMDEVYKMGGIEFFDKVLYKDGAKDLTVRNKR